jgi:hypothetical protein
MHVVMWLDQKTNLNHIGLSEDHVKDIRTDLLDNTGERCPTGYHG